MFFDHDIGIFIFQEPDKMFISSWLKQISSEARSAQLITRDHSTLKALEEVSIP